MMLVPAIHVKELPRTSKGYSVKCTCGNYESGPLYRGIAVTAARMHELLGREHMCYFVHCGTKEVYRLKEGI